MPNETNNIIIQGVTESTLTLNVNGTVWEIHNQLEVLKDLIQAQGQTTFQVGEKIYNIGKINEANFGDVIRNCKNILRNVNIGNVAGNFHNGDIIITNDVKEIIKALNIWWEEQQGKCLILLVVCETKLLLQDDFSLKEIDDRYGIQSEDWIPYIHDEQKIDSILDLLNQFKKETNINTKVLFAQGMSFKDNRVLKQRFRDEIIGKLTLITDGLAINPDNETLLKLFDQKTDESSFLLLLDQKYPTHIREYILTKFEEKFCDTYCRFYEQFARAYPKLELEIPTKNLFFRRLTNIASFMGITSTADMSFLTKCFDNTPLISMKSDGSKI